MPENRLNRTRESYNHQLDDELSDLIENGEVEFTRDKDRDYAVFIFGVLTGLVIAVFLLRFIA